TMAEPVRIELFDTTIDSIRTFSAEDQRSTGKLNSITLLPATEFIWTPDELQQVSQKVEQALGESLTKIKSEELQQQLLMTIMQDIGMMKDGIVPEAMKKYASFSSEASAMLTDYLPTNGLIIFDELGRIQESVATLE